QQITSVLYCQIIILIINVNRRLQIAEISPAHRDPRVIELNGRKFKMIMKNIQSTVGQIVTQVYFTAPEPLHPDSAQQCFLLLNPAVTCIRFVRRTNEYDFISIVSKTGCYSELGRKGGQQELSINRGGCMYSGIIQHELNHALGFQHEQIKSDRDSYVRINWENIIPASAYNFNKHDTNNLNTPYDYSSIMHYGRDAFSIAHGRDSITPIPNPNVPIGQRNGMSRWDITRIKVLYNCR
uniref:Metalloendopeptidase n=1 Tax=Oryzias latipes TaxID=8090 RepID=A0A3P9MHS1_ORYLA